MNGRIYIATDVKDYFVSINNLFEASSNLKIINSNSFHTRPKKILCTRYEKKAIKKKIKPLYLEAKKILD